MPTRRELTFATLDDVVTDAETLLARGYDRAGNWDLSQCCGHVADWFGFPLDGFPKPPLPIRAMLWVVRKTVGRAKFEKYVRERSFPAGKPTMPQTVHATGGDAVAAVARLRAVVERFKGHAGPLHPSPLFGPLNKDEATRLQLVHAAHHLSS